MYISHSKTGERSLPSSSSSVLSPNCPRVRRLLPSLLPSSYPFPALPSPLPPRRCRHHISWPQKGICSRERIRPLPSPLSARRRGREKRKERERVRASGALGRVTQGFDLPICSPFDDIMIIIVIRWEDFTQHCRRLLLPLRIWRMLRCLIIISDAPSFSQGRAENIFPSFPLLLLANFPSCNRDLECINEVEGESERESPPVRPLRSLRKNPEILAVRFPLELDRSNL